MFYAFNTFWISIKIMKYLKEEIIAKSSSTTSHGNVSLLHMYVWNLHKLPVCRHRLPMAWGSRYRQHKEIVKRGNTNNLMVKDEQQSHVTWLDFEPKLCAIFVFATRGDWSFHRHSEWIRLFTAFGLKGHTIYQRPVFPTFCVSATRGLIGPMCCHSWIPLILTVTLMGHSIG